MFGSKVGGGAGKCSPTHDGRVIRLFPVSTPLSFAEDRKHLNEADDDFLSRAAITSGINVMTGAARQSRPLFLSARVT